MGSYVNLWRPVGQSPLKPREKTKKEIDPGVVTNSVVWFRDPRDKPTLRHQDINKTHTDRFNKLIIYYTYLSFSEGLKNVQVHLNFISVSCNAISTDNIILYLKHVVLYLD